MYTLIRCCVSLTIIIIKAAKYKDRYLGCTRLLLSYIMYYIVPTETTVALSYHRVHGLYFLQLFLMRQ